MITLKQDNRCFHFRAAAIALHNGRVLLHRAEHDTFWALPGGRVELREPSPDTVKREMQEELGVKVEVGRLLWVIENFFELGGLEHHELGVYYLVTLPPDSDLYHSDGPFIGDEQGIRLIFKWFPIESLETVEFYPRILRQALASSSLPDGIEHHVHWDHPKRARIKRNRGQEELGFREIADKKSTD